MSLDIEYGDSPPPTSILMQTALEYIPNELILNFMKLDPNNKEVTTINDEKTDDIQILFRSSKEFRMYGTEEELKNNLSIYRDFLGNEKVFVVGAGEAYNTTPVFYNSLKKKQYICKKDILIYLQNYSKYLNIQLKTKLAYATIVIFLKQIERGFDNKLEFIQCSPEDLQDFISKTEYMNTEFKEYNQKHRNQFKLNLKDYTVDELWTSWERLLKFEINEEENKYLKDLIKQESEAICIKQNANNYEEAFKSAVVLKSWFSKKMLTKPDWFNSHNQKNSGPVVIRIFEDCAQKFVMLPELLDVMKTENMEISSIHSGFCGLEEIPTIDFREIYQIIGKEHMMKIEFIITPIKRAKHAAVPIITHNGGHCIFAVDALLEMLRDLIIVKKIFQRANKNDWKRVEEFIEKVTAYFNGDDVSPFFIDIDRRNQIKEECNTEFLILDLQNNAKSVRDVKSDGFTLKDLEDELEYLNITRIFPNILDFANIVHTDILETKYEESLKTSDMYDAIENCQMICIFNCFPKLKLFLHSQKSCHRILNSDCKDCSVRPAAKFKNSTWKEYSITEIVASPSYLPCHPEIRFTDDFIISSTHSFRRQYKMEQSSKLIRIMTGQSNKKDKEFFDESSENLKFLLIDSDDIVYFDQQMKNEEELKERVNFTVFMNRLLKRNEKIFYLRTVSSTLIKLEANRRVLVEEILYIIPIILKQQGSYTNDNMKKLKQLFDKWKAEESQDKTVYATISLTELKEILENFDIDKTRITLVPDPSYSEPVIKEGIHKMTTLDLSGTKKITSIGQALLQLFESIVCKYDWTMTYHCKKRNNCMCVIKEEIISTMKLWLSYNEESFIPEVLVENTIAKIQDLFIAFNQPSTAFSKILDQKPEELVPLSVLLDDPIIKSCAHSFASEEDSEVARKKKVENWRVQIALMFTWLNVFFCKDSKDLRLIIAKCFSLKTPFRQLNDIAEVMNLVIHGKHSRKIPKDQAQNKLWNYEERRDQNRLAPRIEDVFQDVFDNFYGGVFVEKICESPGLFSRSCSQYDEDVGSKIDESVDSITELQSDCGQMAIALNPLDETSKKNSKPDTSEIMDKLEGQTDQNLSTPQPSPNRKNTSKGPEQNANKRKLMKQKSAEGEDQNNTPKSEKQSESCKKCFRTSEICQKTKEELKLELNKTKKLEKKLTNVEKELADLKEKEKEIEMRLKKKFEEEMHETTRKFEEIMRKKDQIMNEKVEIAQRLQDKVTQLTKELEEKKEINQDVQDKTPSTSISHNWVSLSNSKTHAEKRVPKKQEISEEMRKVLIELQNAKDKLLNENSMGQARDRVNRFLSHLSDRNTSERVNHEFRKFKKDFRIYLEAIDNNILMIQNDYNITSENLQPMPVYPNFSKEFMNKYNELINGNNGPISRNNPPNRPNTSAARQDPSDELDDKECVICTDNMISINGTQKCLKCKRRFHDMCIFSWLKIKSICPACDAGMLDPNEYPALS